MDTSPPFDPVRQRRGGRHRKPDNERLDAVIKIRVTTDHLAEIKARADEVCLSLSEYGRATFENNPVRVTIAPRPPPEVIRQLRIMGYNVDHLLHQVRPGSFVTLELEAAILAAMKAISTELRRLLHGIQGASPDWVE